MNASATAHSYYAALRNLSHTPRGPAFNHVLLNAYRFYTYEQMSDAAGVSKTSICNWLRRAREETAMEAPQMLQAPTPSQPTERATGGITLSALLEKGLISQADIDELATPPAPVVTPVVEEPVVEAVQEIVETPVADVAVGNVEKADAVIAIYKLIQAGNGKITQSALGAVFGRSGSWVSKTLVEAGIRLR